MDTTSNTTTTSDIDDLGGTARRGSKRRGTALGVGAGLVGGGLVGLLLTVPSLTNAASQDTGSTDATVAAVQVEDDDAARPEPGEGLREVLQPLVDDGTIDAAQADAVATYLAEHRPEGRGPRGGEGHGPGRPGMDGEVVAELLGIDAGEVRDAIRSGQSIADLAAANGVDVQTVIDALVADAEEHIQLAVDNGRLTEDEAADKLVDITERITARVNGERPSRPDVAPDAAPDAG